MERTNGGSPLCVACFPCDCAHCGELIINENGYRVKKNIYVTEHVFPAAGSYLIRCFDPNRNKGVINIPRSDDQPFYIESLLIINNFTGANTSPQFKYDPIDRACMGSCFYHNPGAFDPDGDSLSYALSTSKGVGGQTIPGYTIPDAGPGGSFSIDPVTGRLTWCTPQLQGEYNIAFVVTEWRKNTSGKREIIGTVLRDMQVLVQACPKNSPPFIKIPADTCVEAGAVVTKKIIVSDPNHHNIVELFGEAGAFEAELPRATLTKTIGVIDSTSGSQYSSTFIWQTSCTHVREQKYFSTFKAQDNQEPKQVYFATFGIKVIPTAVKNLSATPQGAAIFLSWPSSTCSPPNNPLVAYKIYRQKGCDPFIRNYCQTGVPSTSSFKFLKQTGATASSFLDDNNGEGLIVGENYSYLIVSTYKDGSQTYASNQVCVTLKRDVPVITNVDVSKTGQTGELEIRWLNPLTTAGNLDLSVFKGPYTLVLKHSQTGQSGFTEIVRMQHANFTDLETNFFHKTPNTVDNRHEYYLEFYSDTILIGRSAKASSIFLTAVPNDRRIELSWSLKTPWENKIYRVFRMDSATTTFTLVGTSTATTYTDQANVKNGNLYTYYILGEGEYNDPSIPRPLLNRSQILSSRAVDKTPPVTPALSIDADCASGAVELTWTDIISQSDDVASYQLYYKPSTEDNYTLITNINQGHNLVFKSDNLNSIAGCYAIAATDINNNKGVLSPDFCIDNCPEFELPNVFSPNDDDANDWFQAIKVRQVKSIELIVTDRWGNLVYKTSDPYFKWNGVSQITKQSVSEGTFFYVCDVFEMRVKGTVKRTIKGNVTVVR